MMEWMAGCPGDETLLLMVSRSLGVAAEAEV
jgi:hypothetical protein